MRLIILLGALITLLLFSFGMQMQPLVIHYAIPAGLLLLTFALIYLLLLRYRKWILALLSIIASLVIVEAAFAVLEIRNGYLVEQTRDDPGGPAILTLHPDLVYWMNPNIEGAVSRRFGDTFAYKDVPFHTDELGRRACPPPAGPAEKHAMFFGGSFTFGQGITDEQTVPCIFQALSGGEYQAYNFGKNGYGAGQMFVLLRDGEFFGPDMQPRGIAVYDFIEDHVWRTVGEVGKLTNESLPWMEFPLFKTDPETGELRTYKIADQPGVHKALRGVQVVRLLSPTARFFLSRLHLPLAPQDEAIRIMAAVVGESKRMYEARFSGEFFVILWPRVGLDPAAEKAFAALLEAEGVRVVDVPELPAGVTASIHPRDDHPSIEEYRWVAEYFYDYLEQR